mgnify:CR=1 FL=1
MTLEEIQREVVAEFDALDDWLVKYEHLIRLGKALPKRGADFRNRANSMAGCQSRVWLSARLNDGTLDYAADSDAAITRGILALLLRILDGRPPCEIANADLFFVEEIGVKTHLSPARANGFGTMLKRMQALAAEYCDQDT